MNYISYNDIIEMNGIFQTKGLNFKIHLRDACGKQSCWIEPLGNCACEGHYDEMYTALEEYFSKKEFTLMYAEDKLNFWVLN